MFSFHEQRHKVFQHRLKRPSGLTLVVSCGYRDNVQAGKGSHILPACADSADHVDALARGFLVPVVEVIKISIFFLLFHDQLDVILSLIHI